MDEFKELYENLSPNKLSIENVAQLESKVDILEQEVKQLETALDKSEHDKRNLFINFEKDKKILLSNNESLLANLSALYKTAKREIERKDNTIKELRQQLDDFVFRRHKKLLSSQNEVGQSQNEEDAICVKSITEATVASVIRRTAKNNKFIDSKKSSSRDRSPLLARPGAKHREYSEKDKYSDSSRVKCIENAVLECKLKDDNNFKYLNNSTAIGGPRDEHAVRNSDSCHFRKSDRIRETDDVERRIRVDLKSKDRQRYSPYEHRKEDHDRSRHKHHRRERDHKGDEYSKVVAKRSSADRNRQEFEDEYRSTKDNFRQDIEFSNRKWNEDRRKDDHSSRATSNDRRKEAEFYDRMSKDDRRKVDRTFIEFSGRRSNEGRINESGFIEFNGKKSSEERRNDASCSELSCRKSNENRKKVDSILPEFNSRKSNEDHRKVEPILHEFSCRKSNEDRRKLDSILAEFSSRNSNEDHRKGESILPEFSNGRSNDDRRKTDPTFTKSSCIISADRRNDSDCSELRIKKLKNDRKRVDPTLTELSSTKFNEDKKGKIVPPTHPEECTRPVDGPIKVADILAQYGVYATPYKLLNGVKGTTSNFKLVSPIADTPDHLKALFNHSKTKISPIPMINERRALDGFNSPVKKPVTPLKEILKKELTITKSQNNFDLISETPSLSDNFSAVEPSPSKLLMLNTVTTSPFKNCCIVKVKAEVVNSSNGDSVDKLPAAVTVGGTDSTTAEHGVFTRKRRAPVIRYIKKAES